ncbi:HEAT repeat-containing protein 1 [Phlyctochytrium planicorne]|nr:HEAT repeat-containing protein 1 [Phlyctochytrium planicorne]
MSALKGQLEALAAARPNKFVPSILFDAKTAKEMDLESIYAIGCNGLAALIELDPEFVVYEKNLFSEKYKGIDRNLLDKKDNAGLDKSIKAFLRTLSKFFLQSPSMKALEWVIRRFNIHVHNASDLMACVLPYHETTQFARVAAILNLANLPEYAFLEYTKKQALGLDRINLAKRCLKDASLFKRICEMFEQTVDAHPSMSSFFARTVSECLDHWDAKNDNFLRSVSGTVFKILKNSKLDDKKLAIYLVVSRMVEKVSLSFDLSSELVEAILSSASANSANAAALLIISVMHKAEGGVLSINIIQSILDSRHVFPELLSALKRVDSQQFIQGLMTVVAQNSTKLNVESLHRMTQILQTVRIQAHTATGIEQSKGTVNNILYKLVSSTYKNSIFEPVSDSGATLFLNLNHIDEGVRLSAFRRFVKILGTGVPSVRLQVIWSNRVKGIDSVEDILLHGLQDEDSIAGTVLQLKNIEQLISWKALVPSLLRLSSSKVLTLRNSAISVLVRLGTLDSIKEEEEVKETLLSLLFTAFEVRLQLFYGTTTKQDKKDRDTFHQLTKEAADMSLYLLADWALLLPSTKKVKDVNGAGAFHFMRDFAGLIVKDGSVDLERNFIKKCISSKNMKTRAIAFIISACWIESGIYNVNSVEEVLKELLVGLQNSLAHEKILEKLCSDVFITVSTFRHVELAKDTYSMLFGAILKDNSLRFLSEIWIRPDVSIFARARALEMASVFMETLKGKAADYQLVLPLLLAALSSPSKIIRSGSLLALRGLRKVYTHLSQSASSKKNIIFGKETFYGERTSSVLFLTVPVAQKFVNLCLEFEKEILADPSYLKKWIGTILSPNAKDSQLSEHVTIFLLTSIIANPKMESKSVLMGLLSHVDTPLKIKHMFDVIRITFAEKRVESALSPLESHFRLYLVQCFTPKSIEALFSLKSGKYLTLFLDVLSKGTKSEVTAALQAVDKSWLGKIPASHQPSTLWGLLTGVVTASPDSAAILKKSITTLEIDAELFVHALSECHRLLNSLVERSAKKVKSTSEDRDIFFTLSVVLETIESRSSLIANNELLSVLFDIMGDILTISSDAMPYPIDYIRQLAVSVCLNVVNHLHGQDASIREDSIRVDLVVQCIRASDNPQTHNSALLLMAALAKLFPDSVLVNVIPVFTFMGANVMRRDDSYSFFVIQQTLEVIVPALVSRRSTESGYSDEVVKISQIFVDSFGHIPKHRRLRLFILLATTLGPKVFLHLILAIFLQKASSKSPGVSQDADGIPAFCLNLLHHFDCGVQLEVLVNFLRTVDSMVNDEEEFQSAIGTSLTGKALRYFKLVSFDFLAEALGSKSFGRKLALNMTPKAIENLLGFLEALLGIIEASSAHEDTDDVSASVTKYHRGLQKRLYLALNNLNLLLPFHMFLEVAVKLIGHHEGSVSVPLSASVFAGEGFLTAIPQMRRRAAMLLSDRMYTFSEEDFAKSRDTIRVLLEQIHQQLKASEDESEKEKSVRQALLVCVNSMAETICKREPEAFIALVPTLLGGGALAHPERKIRAFSVKSVTTLRELGPRLIPFLPQIMKSVLKEIGDDEFEPEHVAFLQAIDSIVETLPFFVGTYLPDILSSLLGRSFDGESERTVKSQLDTKKQEIIEKIAEKVPARIVIPMFQKFVVPLVTIALTPTSATPTIRSPAQTASTILDFIGMISILVSHLEKSDVLQFSKELVEVFLRLFDFRRVAGVAGEDVVGKVEVSAISAFQQLVLKLNERLFRPTFLNLKGWCEDRRIQQGVEHRQATFYRVMDSLMSKLKSIFAPYFTQMVDPCIQALDKYKDKFVVDEAWMLMMGCLQKYFTYNPDFAFTPEKFQNLFTPIVEQIDLVSLHGDDYMANCVQYIVPTIGSLAVASSKEVYWKPLNKAILNASRSKDVQVRVVCVKVLKEFYVRLGEEFLTMLPETVPFMAELMEDAEEEVQAATQELAAEVQKHLGEDLSTFFT